jgi:hypothetical protein
MNDGDSPFSERFPKKRRLDAVALPRKAVGAAPVTDLTSLKHLVIEAKGESQPCSLARQSLVCRWCLVGPRFLVCRHSSAAHLKFSGSHCDGHVRELRPFSMEQDDG